MNATIEASANAEWWQQLPWESIALWFFIFWLGTIYADLMSKKSDIRTWVKTRLKKFEITKVTYSPNVSNPHYNHWQAIIRLRFKKAVKSSIILSVETCFEDNKFQQIGCEPLREEKSYQKGEEIELVFAQIPFTISREKKPLWCFGKNTKWMDYNYRSCCTIMIGNQKSRVFLEQKDILVTENNYKFYFEIEK